MLEALPVVLSAVIILALLVFSLFASERFTTYKHLDGDVWGAFV